MNPYATIRVDVYLPDHGDDGLIYSNQRMIPIDSVLNERFDGYTTFEIQEMLVQLRRAVKGAIP